MKAIVFDKPGDENVLRLGEAADPRPDPAEVLINVQYAGVNHADVAQRQGNYPPPPGASPILGLECAGEIAEIGSGVTRWQVGERVMALLAGGGYAQKAVVHQDSAMSVPACLREAEAAAMPEVYLTAYLNLFMLGGAKRGDGVLVHGGGSGVGTASIELLKEAGARTLVTAGSNAKCEQCLKLGADVAINYKDGPFAPKVKAATNGRGVDFVLDLVGAAYLAQNLEVLYQGGRLLLVGLQGGARGEIDLALVMRRHLRVIGSTLRSRPVEEKARIVAAFLAQFGAALEAGRLRPPIYKILALEQAAEAHRIMQASEHFGKIVLQVP